MCCCILIPDKMPPVILQGALSYDRKSSGSHEGEDVVSAFCICVHLSLGSLLPMSIFCDCPQILNGDLKPFFYLACFLLCLRHF